MCIITGVLRIKDSRHIDNIGSIICKREIRVQNTLRQPASVVIAVTPDLRPYRPGRGLLPFEKRCIIKKGIDDRYQPAGRGKFLGKIIFTAVIEADLQ